ncbi:MAG: alpha/beta hydrolase family protein [Acidobacteria bacterium]|nr:alpha/beta hydrolase family protein [Acidobacteriota bacterium]
MEKSTNRRVLPFEWGIECLIEGAGGEDPERLLGDYVENSIQASERFYDPHANGHVGDHAGFLLTGGELTFQSAIPTPYRENNVARFRYFPAPAAHGAVLVLPQWNADERSHVTLCRVIQATGISALRMTLPYHGARRPSHLERSDYMISPNIGRTIQAVRQALLDLRRAIDWLSSRGYRQFGIAGTSIGSCIAFLAYCHEPRLQVAVCNHVSGYFADAVWTGITTRHVREGIETHLELEALRRYWSVISPLTFAPRLRNDHRRRILLIAARYDLSFLPHLSQQIMDACRKQKTAHDVAWLPCGHYTSGAFPFNFYEGYLIARYLRSHIDR